MNKEKYAEMTELNIISCQQCLLTKMKYPNILCAYRVHYEHATSLVSWTNSNMTVE